MDNKNTWCRCGTKMKTAELNGYLVSWCENCDKLDTRTEKKLEDKPIRRM